MDKKSTPVPGTNRASATTPEDLHVPEHEPPSMPEAADKPKAATKDQVADLAASTPAKVGGSIAPRATGISASETDPEDMHEPEHEPPSMPEAADKPEKPARGTSTEPLH
jgi:hypothetical protein